ncbi:MAG: TatD family hydrolase [Prevotellaceae bacterium]|nr:TatD family hydrolase [Prevotellaceae bacterium]
MFVDIHTHHFPTGLQKSVCNLSVEDARVVLHSEVQGLFSAGFHPWYLNEYSGERMSDLKTLISDKRIAAIGECGLDKNSRFPSDKQTAVFEQQINLSEEARKPLIIHCVGCFNELLALKKKLKPEQMWIIHGFRGKPQLAEDLLKAGCALSFGEKFNEETVRITPFDRLFVETDESKEGIEIIYRRIADVKQCDVLDLYAGADWFNSL